MTAVAEDRFPRADWELRIENISKNFGGLQLFRDLSFVLDAGNIMGVIGPNGAGKTTLINVICGQLPLSSGKIYLGKRDVTGLPPHTLSRLGLVRSFQQTNTFKLATVRENLMRAMRFAGSGPDTWNLIDDLLDAYELKARLDEVSDSLPYGLQKMLGLLLAYVTKPKVLLLDEPAAGLEQRERGNVDRLVMHAQENIGCSILIIEHDMELIRRLCPHIIVLDAGNVLAAGAPDEVLSTRSVIDAYVGRSDDDD